MSVLDLSEALSSVEYYPPVTILKIVVEFCRSKKLPVRDGSIASNAVVAWCQMEFDAGRTLR